MTRRTALTAGFLTVTGAAIAWELVAAFDGDPDTVPWTDLIVGHVPWPITALGIAVLVCWLPVHFWMAYRAKKRGEENPKGTT